MLKLTFLISVFIYTIICYKYYRNQNTKNRIGGPIAPAKMLWLGIASYHYFVLSLVITLGTQISPCWTNLIYGIIILLFTRALLQCFLMFLFHKWSPPMGIFSNILCALFLIGTFIYNFPSFTLSTFTDILIASYLILLCLILIVDSIYAYKFYLVVGPKTKGREAIWYATEKDPEFLKIIQLTKRLNYFFVFYFAFLSFQILFIL